jgi:DNA-binding NarL/FixJ family response regulator
MIRVAIADDHAIFRQGLLKLLQTAADITVVGAAGDGREALELIDRERPDLAVLDIAMPGLNGLELADELNRLGLATRVIFLTMHNDLLTARKAIRSTAWGYLPKDDAFEELLQAIRAVAAGRKFISPRLSDQVFAAGAGQGKTTALTERECQVLGLIAAGLTNKQVGDRLFISVKTVETHRTKIMHKLGVHSTADLVKYAIRTGIYELE